MKKYLIIFMLLSVCSIQAQHSELEVGFGFGVANYWGDLNADSFGQQMTNSRAAAQVYLRYNISDFIGLRANLSIGGLNGDDGKSNNIGRQRRNLHFKSHVAELALLGEINLFGISSKYRFRRFSPYGVGGIALFHFNPKTVYNGNTFELRPLGTEGQGLDGYSDMYKLIQLALPFGGGVKYKLAYNITLNVEILGRYTLTDYIDDVSGFYASFDDILAQNGSIAAYLSDRRDEFEGSAEGMTAELTNFSKRGSPTVNDFYFTGMLGFSILLDGKTKWNLGRKKSLNCPALSR